MKAGKLILSIVLSIIFLTLYGLWYIKNLEAGRVGNTQEHGGGLWRQEQVKYPKISQKVTPGNSSREVAASDFEETKL